MKFLALLLSLSFCLAAAIDATAQQRFSQHEHEHRFGIGLAPFSLLLPSGKANLHGEWVYAHNKSLSLLVSVPRPTPAPGFLGGKFDLEDDVATTTNRFTSFGAVLEQRFYLGKNAPNGFYLAPYGRYNNFSLTRTTQHADSPYKTTVKGGVGGFGVGAASGVQFRLGDFLTLDATLVGVDIKWLSGSFLYTTNDPEADLAAFRDRVQGTVGDIPFIGSKLVAAIDGDVVKVRTPGLPMPAYRFNLTLNYVF
ncbi:MAG: hypothetical protein KF734_10665 [Saprospiraceae bacterium]|nr:hypothetical protein [Saprospiraceae bacterium]